MEKLYKIVNGERVECPEEEQEQYARDLIDYETVTLPKEIRNLRHRLLVACDWTQAKDIPDSVSAAWVTYRQALRDVPQQPGFPTNVTWPIRPDRQTNNVFAEGKQ